MPRGAGLEDLVSFDQAFDLGAEAADLLHHLLGFGNPSGRQIVLDAADAVEVGVEATAGGGLDLVEDVLTVAEGEEHRRDGTHLNGHVAQEERDVGDAAQLEQERADPLGPGRRLDLHELLGGQDERHLVGKAAKPVDAVDECGYLRVGADFGELLVAPVHVAHHRIGRHHLFAIKLGDDAQRSMGGGVLRADVEGHALGFDLEVDASIGRLAVDVAPLLVVGGGHDSASSSSPGMSSTSTIPGQGFTRRASSG